MLYRIEDLKKQKYNDTKKQFEAQKSPIFEDPLFPRSISSVGPIKGFFSSKRGNRTEPKFESGLVDNHAYSITKVVEFESNGTVHQLVRVRNPWGNSVEWTGPWSDDSAEWKDLSDEEKTHLGLQKDDDGEFFMAYNDFVHHFDMLDICHVSMHSFDNSETSTHRSTLIPESTTPKQESWTTESWDEFWNVDDEMQFSNPETSTLLSSLIPESTTPKVESWTTESNNGWHNQEIHGSWTNGAKEYENPQYLVELKDTDSDSDETCTCLISLLQIGGRRRRAEGRTFRKAFLPIRKLEI